MNLSQPIRCPCRGRGSHCVIPCLEGRSGFGCLRHMAASPGSPHLSKYGSKSAVVECSSLGRKSVPSWGSQDTFLVYQDGARYNGVICFSYFCWTQSSWRARALKSSWCLMFSVLQSSRKSECSLYLPGNSVNERGWHVGSLPWVPMAHNIHA